MHSDAIRHAGRAAPSRNAVMAYTLAVWPLTISQLALNLVSPYYAQTYGLSLALIGGVLTFGRIFDVVADVIIAWISDRTRSRWGRRKPWVVAGLLLYVPATIALFVPPAHVGAGRYVFTVLFFFLSWTMAFIPYLAQGTELSDDFTVKNRINVNQSATMLVALLCAFLLPVLLIDPKAAGLRLAAARLTNGVLPDAVGRFLTAPAPVGTAYYGSSMLLITILSLAPLVLTLPLYTLFVHEPRSIGARANRRHASPLAALRNRVFSRFILSYLLIIAGYLGRGGLIPFILAYALGLRDTYLFYYMLMYCSSLVVMPVWSRLLERLERRTCIALAGGLEVVGLATLLVVPMHSPVLVGVAFVIMGLPGQTLTMVPYLVAAEASDYARLKTGEESRAIHISLCSLIAKCGSVFAAVNIWIAGSAGFNPTATVQPESVGGMLKLIGLGIPILLLTAGCIGVMGFPLTRRRHAAVRARLDRRDAAEIAAAGNAI